VVAVPSERNAVVLILEIIGAAVLVLVTLEDCTDVAGKLTWDVEVSWPAAPSTVTARAKEPSAELVLPKSPL
jgi:hypothetical protein